MDIQVAGLISPGVFRGGEKITIDALGLKSGNKKRLAELNRAQNTGLDTQRWSFFPKAIACGNQILQETLPCDLLIVDELGPLEFRRAEGWAIV